MSIDSTTPAKSRTGLKFCSKCQADKPFSEFYRSRITQDGFSYYCRSCQLRATRISASRNKNKDTTPDYEYLLIERMKREGIWATSGKRQPGVKWVDIIAWGCIKIETRASIMADGAFQWHIGTKGTYNALQSNHFLVLVALAEYPRFFVFSPFHPVFYKNNRLKTGIGYNPNPKHRKSNNVLTTEMMQYHEDKWYWVNDLLDNMREQRNFEMLNTTYGATTEYDDIETLPLFK